MDPVLGVIIGAIISALSAWVIQLRKLSGNIATSEAASLWQESSSIREDYRERIRVLEDRIVRFEKEHDELRSIHSVLRAENVDLHDKHVKCERKIAQLEERCEVLGHENAQLRNTIQRLGGFSES